MKREGRKQEILDLLIANGSVELDALSEQFSVSKMTIHRDLDELEALGMLRKIRGGATIEAGTQFESDFRFRALQGHDIKEALARKALEFVEPGMTVMINDGSTAAVLGSALASMRPNTVITNNSAVIDELKEKPGICLIALGGWYSAKYNAFFGKVTEDTLATLRADIAFISSPAVKGANVFHMDEAVVRTKRAMMNAATKSVLLVSKSRIDQQALHRLASIDEFEALVTDEQPDKAFSDILTTADTKLTVAELVET